ncbi:hypothetical protein [Dyadobacter psychrotolerans]|uniref:Uncharacterized protein n=1 Tax=Dyadobacter psychrotolerans TaxID=2541721 RepID=A0A4R5DI60_9BACT|nr:hypothetical protein [Dyadobacter psychrotolerans]TDE11630.1 hypothetical protein E0F88_24705 [Dyadobacter psychrotolerans]
MCKIGLFGIFGLIDDESFLADLEIIRANLQDGGNDVYNLTSQMYYSLDEADEDIRTGRVSPHDQLMFEMKELVNEKQHGEK